MTAGRPSKYRPNFAKIAAKLCKLGATNQDLADFFNVNIDTIKEWMNVHEEFSASLKNAKSIFDEKVEKALCRRALGYSHKSEEIFHYKGHITRVPTRKKYPPDPTSAIFWLKNRQPQRWRDKIDHEHAGKDGGDIEVNVYIGEKKPDGKGK